MKDGPERDARMQSADAGLASAILSINAVIWCKRERAKSQRGTLAYTFTKSPYAPQLRHPRRPYVCPPVEPQQQPAFTIADPIFHPMVSFDAQASHQALTAYSNSLTSFGFHLVTKDTLWSAHHALFFAAETYAKHVKPHTHDGTGVSAAQASLAAKQQPRKRHKKCCSKTAQPLKYTVLTEPKHAS